MEWTSFCSVEYFFGQVFWCNLVNEVLTESVVFGGRGQDLSETFFGRLPDGRCPPAARVDELDGGRHSGRRRGELSGVLRDDGLVAAQRHRRVELK